MKTLRKCFEHLPGTKAFVLALVLACVAPASTQLLAQAQWKAIGPDGGDARSFAYEPGRPSHLYLGTTDSWLFESNDQGASWRRLSKLDDSDDLILDHIVVDPQDHATVFVAAWKVNRPDGGMWVSHNSGKSWSVVEGLRGQSIRAFAPAPSNPRTLFAGTLEGVFRSNDMGASWTQISPPGSREIHEVESLAIDPVDPNTIYAGTWHLPWKTTDGGQTWHNIKQGVIDDSDVFSIIIDPSRPSIVFASACSGIYKSESAGELFKKIQGIPSSARRTRVLKMDPVNHDVVYAGTTEGLYKSVDGGKTFELMTQPEVIVNDVYVDPSNPQNVLLATDRGGVITSRNGAEDFTPANVGFSGRKVEAMLIGRADPGRIIVGVANDKTFGGVFATSNGGANWEQLSNGLDGRDVFSLSESADGTLAAGTNRGIFVLTPGTPKAPGTKWVAHNTIQNFVIKKSTVLKKGKKVPVETKVKDKPREAQGLVYALDLSGDAWLASTTSGLLTSTDRGASWQGGLVQSSGEYVAVAAHGAQMAAARRDGVVVSVDAGQSWTPSLIPPQITRIYRAVYSADGKLWLGTREGLFFTRDQARTWESLERMPFRDINDIYYDAASNRLLTSSRFNDWVYAVDAGTLKWTWLHTGWRIGLIRAAGGRLMGASLYDGVLAEADAGGGAAGQR